MRRTQRIVLAKYGSLPGKLPPKRVFAVGTVEAVVADEISRGAAPGIATNQTIRELVEREQDSGTSRFRSGHPVVGFGAFRCSGVVRHVLGRFVVVQWDDQARPAIYDAKKAETHLIGGAS